jgi:hypothetical protein
MPKRKTHEEFVLQVKNKFPEIGVIGVYTNNKTKIEFQCLVDGCFNKWTARPDNILSGYGCPECAKKKISILRSKTHDEFIEEVAIKNPCVKVLGKYISDSVKIQFQCNNPGCGYKWFTTPDKIIHKITGCPECAKINRAKKKAKSCDTFVDEVYKKNPDIEVIGEYAGAKIKTEFKCRICHNTWATTPDSILNANTGCPICAQSHGERCITNWLKSSAINFMPQHKFDDCRDLECLPFDFYLPEYNLCIEYDGEQHFHPVNFGGISDACAMINFKKTQMHDDIKSTYCIKHNIELLRISYFEKNKIDDILNNVIMNNMIKF